MNKLCKKTIAVINDLSSTLSCLVLLVTLCNTNLVTAWWWSKPKPQPTTQQEAKSEKTGEKQAESPFALFQPSVPIFFTLMIDPSGDSSDPGRTIDSTVERDVTMQWAQELKKQLEAKMPGVRVLLSKLPNETVDQIQVAHFANRLKVQLFLKLQAFHSKKKGIDLFFYQLAYDPAADRFSVQKQGLELLPFDQAYKTSIKQTDFYSNALYAACNEQKEIINKDSGKTISPICHKPVAFPLKTLRGISVPALVLEVGLASKNDANDVTALLLTALELIIGEKKPHE